MGNVGIYIHVPFCEKKCPYCDFYSVPGTQKLHERYVDAILQSIKPYRDRNLTADTVYFGGGTPILLDASDLDKIIREVRSVFSVPENAEITLEANPGYASEEKLRRLKRSGFNRISFGMQSAVCGELTLLGRHHTAQQAKESVFWARKAGFSNVSVDLMLGIPDQTTESLSETLDFVDRMQVDHVSAYLLKIEPETPFDCDRIRTRLPEEDELCDLYLFCCERLNRMGFSQYEISNFAKPGKESRHNLKYWNCEEYLGFGPSAHSYFDGKRFYYERNLAAFLDSEKRMILSEVETVNRQEEYLIMRLRLNEGVSCTELNRRFGIDPRQFLLQCDKYIRAGFMEIRGDFLCFTPKGFLVSNFILSELI